MNDIVKRLRAVWPHDVLMHEAADKIECLRSEVDHLAGCLKTSENDRSLLEGLIRKLCVHSPHGFIWSSEEYSRVLCVLTELDDSPDVLGDAEEQ